MIDKRRKNYSSLLPLPIILSALEEDSISIKMILKHYQSYMYSLCLTNGFNEAGQVTIHIDEFMFRQLETKLIEAILRFKVK